MAPTQALRAAADDYLRAIADGSIVVKDLDQPIPCEPPFDLGGDGWRLWDYDQ